MKADKLYTFHSLVEAVEFAGRLVEAGIQSELLEADNLTGAWESSSWRIRVTGDADEQRIAAILTEMAETMLSPGEDAALPCKSCGYDLRGQHGDGQCPECGHRYRDPAPATPCPRCGESVPGTFDLCWSCDQDVGACPKCQAALPRPIGAACPKCRCEFPADTAMA